MDNALNSAIQGMARSADFKTKDRSPRQARCKSLKEP
jgi:hypothetical protein